MENDKIEEAKKVIAEQKKFIKEQKKKAKAEVKTYQEVKKTAEKVAKYTKKMLDEIVDAIGKCPDVKMLITELQDTLAAVDNIEETLSAKYPEAAKIWSEAMKK